MWVVLSVKRSANYCLDPSLIELIPSVVERIPAAVAHSGQNSRRSCTDHDGLWTLTDTPGAANADRAASKSGEVFRTVAGTDATSVFVVAPIENIVAAIFDGPMPPVSLEEASGIRMFLGETADSIGDVEGSPVLFVHPLPREPGNGPAWRAEDAGPDVLKIG